MPKYDQFTIPPGAQGPTIAASPGQVDVRAGACQGTRAGTTLTFTNGPVVAQPAHPLGNDATSYVFVTHTGAAWLDMDKDGTHVPGDYVRIGRVWRDAHGGFVFCQGVHAGNRVTYDVGRDPTPRYLVAGATGSGTVHSPFVQSGVVTLECSVTVSGTGTAIVTVTHAGGAIDTYTFDSGPPTTERFSVGSQQDILGFQTDPHATLTIQVIEVVERLE